MDGQEIPCQKEFQVMSMGWFKLLRQDNQKQKEGIRDEQVVKFLNVSHLGLLVGCSAWTGGVEELRQE